MYEFIKVGEKTYYIDCPAKIGLYKINETDVCLIDSGNDKSAASKVLKQIEANGWNLKIIINTHSHSDHVGGNAYLQQKTNCKIYTPAIEKDFTNNPILEPAFLYGGYPCKELRHKALQAKESIAEELTTALLPAGLETLRIDGHAFAMLAIKTDDDIWFLADSLSSQAILEKYHIPFVYDVANYLVSLDKISTLTAKLFIPSHAKASNNIDELIQINKDKTHEIIDFLKKTCSNFIAFDDILKNVFDTYNLNMTFIQHALVGSSIRSYLSYMYDNNILEVSFENNKLCWKVKN